MPNYTARPKQERNLKPTRTLVPISIETLGKFDKIAQANGNLSTPQLLKQILESIADMDPKRFHAVIVAAQQAGMTPTWPSPPRPVGRPPNKAT